MIKSIGKNGRKRSKICAEVVKEGRDILIRVSRKNKRWDNDEAKRSKSARFLD